MRSFAEKFFAVMKLYHKLLGSLLFYACCLTSVASLQLYRTHSFLRIDNEAGKVYTSVIL